MTQIIHSEDPFHGDVITRTLDPDQPFRPGYDRVISFTLGGKLLGGIIYNNYMVRSIHMHVLILDRRVVTRKNLFVCFHYPFDVLKCEKVFGVVPSTNQPALDFDLRCGFKETNRIEGAVPDGDLVVLSMTRNQCKWLGA